jgi:hypothetical protein
VESYVYVLPFSTAVSPFAGVVGNVRGILIPF